MKKKKFDLSKFMVYFLAFIMISSVFGIIFSGYNEQTSTYKYNGHNFVRGETSWSTKVNGKTFLFSYHPEEVDYINISEDIKNILADPYQIDTTSNVSSDYKDTIALAQYELSNFLTKYNDGYLRIGFNTENEFNFPIIVCGGESTSVPIIYFTISNQTAITLKDNCIIAQARNDADFIRIKDRLIYSILGIIK